MILKPRKKTMFRNEDKLIVEADGTIRLCDHNFELLAKKEPDTLIDMLDGMGSGDLTFALEELGKFQPISKVGEILLGYMDSLDPLVREGAMLGLAVHKRASGMREHFVNRLEVEISLALRELLSDIISEIDDEEVDNAV